jgi:protein-tyrosine kinase
MSSLIEAAAKRLEQLRSAGASMSTDAARTAVADAVVPPRSHVDGQVPVGGANGRASPVPNPVPVPAPAPTPPIHVIAPEPSSAPVHGVTVDLDALGAKGFVTPQTSRSLINDQYRVVKRTLIRNAVAPVAEGSSRKLIMIASAVAGEGKTFSSVNLAMSIASELDHTVMLVDADVARPSVLRTLGVEGQVGVDGAARGLMDILDGGASLDDVLLATNVDKLTLLPSGSYRPHANELLASDSMRQLVVRITERFPDRIIIFDSPPLLMTTEAQVLASNMGQVVVIVQAGKTTHGTVKHALSTIDSCPVKLLLLNRVDSASEEAGGAYGYGYGYGGKHTQGAAS